MISIQKRLFNQSNYDVTAHRHLGADDVIGRSVPVALQRGKVPKSGFHRGGLLHALPDRSLHGYPGNLFVAMVIYRVVT